MISTATVQSKWQVTGMRRGHMTRFTVLAFDHSEATAKAFRMVDTLYSVGLFHTTAEKEAQRKAAIRAYQTFHMCFG